MSRELLGRRRSLRWSRVKLRFHLLIPNIFLNWLSSKLPKCSTVRLSPIFFIKPSMNDKIFVFVKFMKGESLFCKIKKDTFKAANQNDMALQTSKKLISSMKLALREFISLLGVFSSFASLNQCNGDSRLLWPEESIPEGNNLFWECSMRLKSYIFPLTLIIFT